MPLEQSLQSCHDFGCAGITSVLQFGPVACSPSAVFVPLESHDEVLFQRNPLFLVINIWRRVPLPCVNVGANRVDRTGREYVRGRAYRLGRGTSRRTGWTSFIWFVGRSRKRFRCLHDVLNYCFLFSLVFCILWRLWFGRRRHVDLGGVRQTVRCSHREVFLSLFPHVFAQPIPRCWRPLQTVSLRTSPGKFPGFKTFPSSLPPGRTCAGSSREVPGGLKRSQPRCHLVGRRRSGGLPVRTAVVKRSL